MPKQKPKTFGQGIGPTRPIGEEPLEIDLAKTGIRLDRAASQLQDGESANAIDVRFTGGGVSTDYMWSAFSTPYGGAGPKNVVQIANFEKTAGVKMMMRLRATGWDRWNGVAWFTLAGALTGGVSDRLSYTSAYDKFIVANLVDRLKSWDGIDANAIQDLSGDAPIAKFVTRIGTRLLAAVIKVGGNVDRNLVAWSADGNITNWTSSLLGAGADRPPVEGSNKAANYITGLSTLVRGAILYRQRTVQLVTLTGIGAAPFRFTTIGFTHGTESPYSIASGASKDGDFYLGYDFMVYHFDGSSAATPIGMPIQEYLRDAIADRSLVVGTIDDNEQEYYLSYPIANSLVMVETWVFSIKEYARDGRFVWRRRTTPPNTQSLGFGYLASVSDPIVDTITQIVDTITIRPNDWANAYGPDRILFGDINGQIWQLDHTLSTPGGIFETKEYLFGGNEATADRFRLIYQARSLATVAFAISIDGGTTYLSERILTLQPTPIGRDNLVGSDFNITGRKMMFRIRPLTGFCTINKVEVTIQNRGFGNA